MKFISKYPVLVLLGIGLLIYGLSSLFTKPSTTPVPLPTPTAPFPLQANEVKGITVNTLCLRGNPDSSEAIAISARALSRLGVRTVINNESATCDAVLIFEVHPEVLSATYRVEGSLQDIECATGEQVTGQVVFELPQHASLMMPIDYSSEYVMDEISVSSCKRLADFKSQYISIALSNLDDLFGHQVYVSSLNDDDPDVRESAAHFLRILTDLDYGEDRVAWEQWLRDYVPVTPSISIPACEQALQNSPGNPFICIVSENGDPVGEGKTWSSNDCKANTRSLDATQVATDLGNLQMLDMRYACDTLGEWINMDIRGHDRPLSAGVYEIPTATNDANPIEWEVWRVDKQCATVTGKLEILELVLAGQGEPRRFIANFEQHCNGAAPALRGYIRWYNRNW